MNREELLRMLDEMTGVSSIELKINVPADQRMALSGLDLDLMEARLREVHFFDTPDLTLFHNGLVVRARRSQGGDDDTVVKLRPATGAATKRPRRWCAGRAGLKARRARSRPPCARIRPGAARARCRC